MGITGLLPLVAPACRPARVSEFRSQTVGVDACGWLHRAMFGCAPLLARGKQSDLHVRYCVTRVRMLLSYNIRVVLVFDGRSLPAKKDTNDARKKYRDGVRDKAQKLMEMGRQKEADELFRRATEITFDMVFDVVQACRQLPNVHCLVAPFESDAQLCHMQQAGLIDCVISEDSDLIPFGCSKVLFKMDSDGRGQLYSRNKLHKALDVPQAKFQFVQFRRICILSGCDYLTSLPGIGLKKSIKFFSLTCSNDPRKFLKQVPKVLKMSKLTVPASYVAGFLRAENTFLHQVVFNPSLCRQQPLNPYPEGMDPLDFAYAGSISDHDLAIALAAGVVHPHSLQPMPLAVDSYRPKEVMQQLCQLEFVEVEEKNNDSHSISVLTYSSLETTSSSSLVDDSQQRSMDEGSSPPTRLCTSSYFGSPILKPYNAFKPDSPITDSGLTSTSPLSTSLPLAKRLRRRL